MAMQSTPRHTPKTTVTLTRDQVREVDRIAIDELGIPGILLMENAATAIEEVALIMLAESNGGGGGGGGVPGTVVIAAGPGNNGGDGFALARKLHNRGIGVRVLLTVPGEKYTGDAATNLEILRRLGIGIVEMRADDVQGTLREVLERAGRVMMVVDALLGTGSTSAPRAPLDQVVRWINRMGEAGAWILSVDVPTGVDCDTGAVFGEGEAAVDADRTVTLAAMKPGLTQGFGKRFAGEVTVGDIGVPTSVLERLARG